jgi:hypothetical protein
VASCNALSLTLQRLSRSLASSIDASIQCRGNYFAALIYRRIQPRMHPRMKPRIRRRIRPRIHARAWKHDHATTNHASHPSTHPCTHPCTRWKHKEPMRHQQRRGTAGRRPEVARAHVLVRGSPLCKCNCPSQRDLDSQKLRPSQLGKFSDAGKRAHKRL